jgi:hypothetical protein
MKQTSFLHRRTLVSCERVADDTATMATAYQPPFLSPFPPHPVAFINGKKSPRRASMVLLVALKRRVSYRRQSARGTPRRVRAASEKSATGLTKAEIRRDKAA